MKIKLYNKIAPTGLAKLPADWETGDALTGEDAIIVRSADLHEVEFPATLKAIARAGAGVNNIPLDKCTEQGVVVFNTPGANAQSVAELALAGILFTSRDIYGGMEWSKTLTGDPEAAKKVEKEKSRFQGPEVMGKTLGVIGLGAVGGKLANAAAAIGMKVLGFDPYLSEAAAKELSPAVEVTAEMDRIFTESDYISIHVPSLPSTKGTFGKANLSKCKKGVRLLNLSRADLAVDEDVLAGLESGQIAAYYTDFPTGAVAGKKGVIATPHLGASTPEAEDHCAEMAAEELADFLQNGNITHSVNIPALTLPRGGGKRVGVIFRVEAEQALTGLFAGAQTARNIKGEVGYLLAETASPVDLTKIQAVPGVIRVNCF
ncbi:MAG: 3-phosphoglycerate dehydrogenase [Clostridia bacterium]|nr:3-phosphoglycerate dehydrogenase [Clostridia bacterium]